jgi:hypothetical protein
MSKAKKNKSLANLTQKGSARVPGSGSKKTTFAEKRQLRELVEAELDGDPIPVRIVRVFKKLENLGYDNRDNVKLMLEALGEAAQYCYPKLKQAEVIMDQSVTVEAMSDRQLADILAVRAS